MGLIKNVFFARCSSSSSDGKSGGKTLRIPCLKKLMMMKMIIIITEKPITVEYRVSALGA